MPAPSTPTTQPLIVEDFLPTLDRLAIGALTDLRYVAVDDSELVLYEIQTSGDPVEIDRVDPNDTPLAGWDAYNSFGGVIALYMDAGDGGYQILSISNGTPWSIVTLTSPVTYDSTSLQYAVDRLHVSGDTEQIVVSAYEFDLGEGHSRYGRKAHGFATSDLTALWSVTMPDGSVCIGAPAANRFLQLEADWATDVGTISLRDDSGTTLDTVTFDIPANSWDHNLSMSPTAIDVTMCWVQTTSTVTTYLGMTRDGGPGYGVHIWYRCLEYDAGGDTIAWVDDEQELACDWTDGPLDRLHPTAVAWDGQLAVGWLLEQFE